MKKRKSKKTQNQLEYEKQVRRIKRAIREGEKQGFIFNIDFEIPTKPKRITKKFLEKIAKISRTQIYESAVVVDYETGEITPASVVRERKKKERIQKAQETKKKKKEQKAKETGKKTKEYPTIKFMDSVIEGIQTLTGGVENIRSKIESLQRETGYKIPIENQKNELLNILDDMLFQYEDNMTEYTDYLKSKESEIFELMNKIQYDSDNPDATGTRASFVQLANILNMGTLTVYQAEQISDMSDYYDVGDLDEN